MHVLMLGAGAMGSLLGARLVRTDAKVTLLSTNREHIETVRRDGLTIEELDGAHTRHALTAFHTPGDIREKADLVIVMVKSYSTENAVLSIGELRHPSTVFLTLQNGIGNWERIADLVGRGSVLAGSTAQGATLVGPGMIRHGGNGPTSIGEPQGPPTQRVHSAVDLFRRAGLETNSSDGMEHLIWEKLHVNVGINAITALTGVRNGKIAELKEARELCRQAVEEAMRIAGAKGFAIREDMVERVLSIALATAVNRSSMGQDVDRKKRTEIDAINGAIVRFGEEIRISTPVNRTLTQLIKIMEGNYKATQGSDQSEGLAGAQKNNG